MKTLHSAAVIFAAITFSSLLSTVYTQAPSPAPISAMGPLSPGPVSTPLGPTAQGPAAPGVDCLTPLANMTDCLSYVTEGSNSTAPDPNCCPELAGLVDSNPVCLCQLLSNSSLTSSFGIMIDLSRALKLPTVCRLSTPPVNTCAAIGYPIPPVAGPTADMGPSGTLTPGGVPGALSPGGLASNPSAGGNDSGALSISTSLESFLVGLGFYFLLTIF
ncbi:Bifunctional inhibitor/lipid-transfer protein/seed storage 2S albumin superfamily protein [Euphorbia peplus]|nr:Bifunctional inhibitor/lipid-transfer protein/seed storage 2S albumin superfamily protein [Euphorbia peplus]